MKEIYDILIVDDEPGMRDGIKRVLKPYGHNITTASDGKEAFEIIKNHSFDLALLDLKLPDADGLEILDAILTKDPLTVCVIITAYATLDTAVDATKRGAFDYLAKPFTADQVLMIIDKALDRRDLLVQADELRKERDLSLLELTREQTRFRTIISCMVDGVIVTNRNEQIVLANNTGSVFLEKNRGTIPGTPIDEAIASPDLLEIIKEASKPGEDVRVTGKELEMAGRNWLANCAVLRDENGETLGTVTVFRDITEIKEVEKIKSRFISLVAHELRAPVAAIKGYLDIVLKRAAGNDQKVYDNMLERSRSRADGLLDLIQDLLEMSRIDTRKVQRRIQPVDLNKSLRENLEFFNLEIEKQDLEVINELSDKTIEVMADPEELDRIIINLLSNAVKYNKDGGSVTISAGKNSGSVCFAIADTGIGMTEEEKARLFEDFFRANNPQTRKQPGTGLGLAITKRMVEANFGRIEVESKQGEGSKFTVTLPSA
jgi:two-component system, OmpR family, phosphate regulon sensor histidine kinase PhoR